MQYHFKYFSTSVLKDIKVELHDVYCEVHFLKVHVKHTLNKHK